MKGTWFSFRNHSRTRGASRAPGFACDKEMTSHDIGPVSTAHGSQGTQLRESSLAVMPGQSLRRSNSAGVAATAANDDGTRKLSVSPSPRSGPSAGERPLLRTPGCHISDFHAKDRPRLRKCPCPSTASDKQSAARGRVPWPTAPRGMSPVSVVGGPRVSSDALSSPP